MPAQNTIREYFAGGYYHIYNRGAGRALIFEDGHDYTTFLYLLKKYLTPDFQEKRFHPKTGKQVYLTPNFVYEDLDLLAYCLMPNHFHLLVRNKSEVGVTKLMRRVIPSYVNHFNTRYGLSGGLLQGKYRAVRIHTEEQLLHVSRYIHLNPLPILPKGKALADYSYSSYPAYLGHWSISWLRQGDVLGNFPADKYKGSYQEFAEKYALSKKEQESFRDLLLDRHQPVTAPLLNIGSDPF